MEKNEQTRQLTVELIDRAAGGDREAMDEILRIYEPFHDSLVGYDAEDAYGNVYHGINEDWKIMVQMHMAKVIRTKWRRLI